MQDERNIKINRLKGEAIIPYILDLAHLRIEVFKEYPYLYAGHLEYEEKYLQVYVNSPESVMVAAFDQDKIVGASTALPMHAASPASQAPFIAKNIDINGIFYFGESVLLPEYRGKKIYRHFFHEREAAALAQGFQTTAFCAVDRSTDDPRRPASYEPLDAVWKHFGYEKHPELCSYYDWTEIGNTDETTQTLTYWLKKIS